MSEILLSQLVYKGKTRKYHPKISFPDDWLISHRFNHWSNEETMLQYIRGIMVPFADNTRQCLELPEDQQALGLFDKL